SLLVDGDVHAPAGDVVSDLVAGLQGAAGGRGQLVRRRRTPSAGGDLLSICLQSVSERLGAREHLHGNPAPREVLVPAIDHRAHIGAAAFEQESYDLLDETSLEGLEPPRAEGRALEAHASLAIEQRVGLELVREERSVTAVQLEPDAVRQRRRN